MEDPANDSPPAAPCCAVSFNDEQPNDDSKGNVAKAANGCRSDHRNRQGDERGREDGDRREEEDPESDVARDSLA
jgi:hypothetical protein